MCPWYMRVLFYRCLTNVTLCSLIGWCNVSHHLEKEQHPAKVPPRHVREIYSLNILHNLITHLNTWSWNEGVQRQKSCSSMVSGTRCIRGIAEKIKTHGIWELCFIGAWQVSYCIVSLEAILLLRWRHNGRDSVSHHQPHHCLLYLTVYSDADQRKHQSSASVAFVWGIHRGPVNSPHKWPVTRKMFPFDDVITYTINWKKTSDASTKACAGAWKA